MFWPPNMTSDLEIRKGLEKEQSLNGALKVRQGIAREQSDRGGSSRETNGICQGPEVRENLAPQGTGVHSEYLEYRGTMGK